MARERSGEVDCPLVGNLVCLSSFKVAKLELPISSDKILPLESLMCEFQSASCAFITQQFGKPILR